MKRLALILAAAACVTAVGCDNKETRSGSISLTGSSNIPLNDKSGAHAELVAGQAEITFQKGSKDHTIAILVKQPGRADVNIEAPVNGDPRSGDFTLRGADIGQPVDMISARRYNVTGPSQRWERWEDRGFERCMVETQFDPCDESWTVDFRNAAGAVGSFSALTATRCNERSYDAFCQPNGREPRIPDFPRGPHGRGLQNFLNQDPTKVNFD